MNLRESSYFTLTKLRGFALGKYYRRFCQEDQNGIPIDTTKKRLIRLLKHCKQSVPYYAEIMKHKGETFSVDPETYLRTFPILTKDIIRNQFEKLKSIDLANRKWFLNSSGGSTGMPIQLIQDSEYAAQAGAIKLLFVKLAGKEAGGLEVRLWASTRDIQGDTKRWKGRFINWLNNVTFLNAGFMSPECMREYIKVLNTKHPELILAYVEAIYELAKFAQQEGLEVLPQNAIMTTAGTLYPFMREKIESVFHCRIYNKYGSREVGDIACERPGWDGLWVAPWGNYLEIVDEKGERVPDGCEGDILVTSLTNHAMPLIRYSIGDRGILSSETKRGQEHHEQVLAKILGRSMEFFRDKDNQLINPGFFMASLYFRDWISKYQVIQKNRSLIVYKMVKCVPDLPHTDLEDITAITKSAMGEDCEIVFEFVDDIPASDSGKFRFLISEIHS